MIRGTAQALRGSVTGEIGRLLSRTAVMVSARVVGSLLTLLYTVLLARVTTPEQLGIVMTAMSAAMLLSVLMSLNLESGSIQFLVKYLHDGQAGKAAGFVAFCWLTVAVATSISVTVHLGYCHFLGTDGTGLAWPYLQMVVAAPIIALTRIDARHATALDAVLEGILPRLLLRPLLFTLGVGAAFIIGATISATFVMIIFIVTAAMVAALQVFLLQTHLSFVRTAGRDFSEWREWIRTGIMLVPILMMVEFRRELLITSASFGMAADLVARFGVALAVFNFLNFALSAVDTALSPRIARALARDSMETCRRLFAAGAAIKSLALFGGAAILFLIRDPVLGMFGKHYLEARDTFLVLLAMPVANALTGPASTVLNILGQRRGLLIGGLAGIVSMAVATPLGGHFYGINGAAIGASAGYVLMQVIIYLSCRTGAGIDPSIFAVVARLVSGPRKQAAVG